MGIPFGTLFWFSQSSTFPTISKSTSPKSSKLFNSLEVKFAKRNAYETSHHDSQVGNYPFSAVLEIKPM